MSLALLSLKSEGSLNVAVFTNATPKKSRLTHNIATLITTA